VLLLNTNERKQRLGKGEEPVGVPSSYLEFLEGEVCGCLVIAHVVVPSLRKFQKLSLLSSLDVLQFLLLCSSDVVSLTLSLFLEQLVKLGS